MKKAHTKANPREISPFNGSSSPPGREKLANGLRGLLKTKDFGSITTSGIAKASGVNEALIYRYFGNKRGLLHGVLSEHLHKFTQQVTLDLKGIKGAQEKLKKLIWSTVHFYDQDRILAKMLVLEVRAHKDYFKSETYRSVKIYSQLILDIIQEGISNGEFKSDVSPRYVRQILLGSIEHLLLPAIIHDGLIDVDLVQQELCNTLLNGIGKR
ncbi:MAG: TetR/AcrR family transcriptional regulator [Deltaproteobacteria bacterium]|nr:TetR/AcrR family transcriptional regulator [Deltaproteobacteria bacterium]MBT7893124.1 TetR/AcrR family transcriptional regulator [Deltaproteobacteria bacterium]